MEPEGGAGYANRLISSDVNELGGTQRESRSDDMTVCRSQGEREDWR